MDHLLKYVRRAFARGRDQYNVVIVGINGAGKTTLLYQLKGEKVVCTCAGLCPGLVQTAKLDNGINCNAFDTWSSDHTVDCYTQYSEYLNSAEVIVCVVDCCSDRCWLIEQRDELYRLLASMQLPSAIPLLVFANKQDKPSALSVQDITELFKLADFSEREWLVQACSAIKNEGLEEGFDKLLLLLKQYRARKAGKQNKNNN